MARETEILPPFRFSLTYPSWLPILEHWKTKSTNFFVRMITNGMRAIERCSLIVATPIKFTLCPCELGDPDPVE